MLVIVPGRVKAIYADLAVKGYSLIEPDNPAVKKIITALAPIFPIDPILDETIPAWKCRNIAILEKRNTKQIMIYCNTMKYTQNPVRLKRYHLLLKKH